MTMNTLSGQAQESFISMMNELTTKLAEQGAALPQTGLVVADIGAGSMPYAPALERWALQHCAKPRIFAIDYRYAGDSQSYFSPLHIPVKQNPLSVITEIPLSVEDAKERLAASGVSKVHLFTMFNPYTEAPLPSVAPLEKLAQGTPLVGAVNRADEGYCARDWLAMQGYHVTLYRSPMGDFMRKNLRQLLNSGSSLWSSHDPMFVAIPKRL